jgi:hypothetical protein
MIVQSTQLPTLFPSYDERASQPISAIDVQSVDIIEGKDFEGHGKGGTNYWVNDDPRPTKEEALEKLEDFNLVADIVDYLVPEEISNNIPFWIRGPYGIAPEVAELLIEIDPLDRIED